MKQENKRNMSFNDRYIKSKEKMAYYALGQPG